MNSKLTLNIDKSISKNESKDIDYNALGHITKQLLGFVKTNKKGNYKELLEKVLTEKYL
jgi:hypothetical protein